MLVQFVISSRQAGCRYRQVPNVGTNPARPLTESWTVTGVARNLAWMRRYWLTFQAIGKPHPINLGCGVTAVGLEDALLMVRTAFPDLSLGQPVTVAEDVDLSTLDERHILPNLGNVLEPGMWWPQTM